MNTLFNGTMVRGGGISGYSPYVYNQGTPVNMHQVVTGLVSTAGTPFAGTRAFMPQAEYDQWKQGEARAKAQQELQAQQLQQAQQAAAAAAAKREADARVAAAQQAAAAAAQEQARREAEALARAQKDAADAKARAAEMERQRQEALKTVEASKDTMSRVASIMTTAKSGAPTPTPTAVGPVTNANGDTLFGLPRNLVLIGGAAAAAFFFIR